MRVAELLARDRFAVRMGVRLVETEPGRVVVEMDVGADHLENGGRIASGTLFSLADCAMSLISNAETTALAVATHLTRSGDGGGARVLRADIRPALPGGDRETTWRATLTADDVEVASFTGTTLRVGKG